MGIRFEQAKSILTRTGGFIAAAGFTHSLTPARNCTFGCLYCYVPTLLVFGGLKREDWLHWGAFTTFKANTAALLHRVLRPGHIIYCSPLVDPYQPAEAVAVVMPAILDEIAKHPPRVFVIQTRGPLILRDLDALKLLAVPCRISERLGFAEWHDPAFQAQIVERIRRTVEAAGRRLGVGTTGFGWLAAS